MAFTFRPKNLSALTARFSHQLRRLAILSDRVARGLHLITGKKAKGDQLVSVLGEAAVAALTGGKVLPGEDTETDVVVGKTRISVKTRRGNGKGWTQTSPISANHPGTVDYLAFVHLNDSYAVNKIWLFPWKRLLKDGRIRPKKVRGTSRGFLFHLSKKRDASFLVFNNSRSRVAIAIGGGR